MNLKVGKQPNVYQSEKNDWVVTLDAYRALSTICQTVNPSNVVHFVETRNYWPIEKNYSF